MQLGGLNVGVWYPTTDKEESFQYTPSAPGSVARNGAVNRCSSFPLVVFSHGFGGCGIQSLFITEELARRGYIVAAPDHADATCSVNGTGMPRPLELDQSFLAPEKWNDQTQAGRRGDIERTISGMQSSAEFGAALTPGRVGAVGHSLGGYTALGVGGGWSSWQDSRISAVLALSPYLTPFLLQNRFGSIRVPVMYQGAQFDVGITPSLPDAYRASNSPKFYAELMLGNHFVWTNLECTSKTGSDCVRMDGTARLITDYGIAFLDRYLKGDSGALQRLSGSGLATYEANP
jgi:predicted dienelactone hydrolase